MADLWFAACLVDDDCPIIIVHEVNKVLVGRLQPTAAAAAVAVTQLNQSQWLQDSMHHWRQERAARTQLSNQCAMRLWHSESLSQCLQISQYVQLFSGVYLCSSEQFWFDSIAYGRPILASGVHGVHVLPDSCTGLYTALETCVINPDPDANIRHNTTM